MPTSTAADVSLPVRLIASSSANSLGSIARLCWCPAVQTRPRSRVGRRSDIGFLFHIVPCTDRLIIEAQGVNTKYAIGLHISTTPATGDIKELRSLTGPLPRVDSRPCGSRVHDGNRTDYRTSDGRCRCARPRT